MSEDKIAIPWGYWDLHGNWYPNPLLEMTEDEQYRQNVKNGFIRQIRIGA